MTVHLVFKNMWSNICRPKSPMKMCSFHGLEKETVLAVMFYAGSATACAERNGDKAQSDSRANP